MGWHTMAMVSQFHIFSDPVAPGVSNLRPRATFCPGWL